MIRAIAGLRALWYEFRHPNPLPGSRTEAMRRLLDKAGYEPHERWKKVA